MLLLLYHAIHAIYDDPVTALCHDAVTALYSMIYCAVCYCAYDGDPVAAVCEMTCVHNIRTVTVSSSLQNVAFSTP